MGIGVTLHLIDVSNNNFQNVMLFKMVTKNLYELKCLTKFNMKTNFKNCNRPKVYFYSILSTKLAIK